MHWNHWIHCNCACIKKWESQLASLDHGVTWDLASQFECAQSHQDQNCDEMGLSNVCVFSPKFAFQTREKILKTRSGFQNRFPIKRGLHLKSWQVLPPLVILVEDMTVM